MKTSTLVNFSVKVMRGEVLPVFYVLIRELQAGNSGRVFRYFQGPPMSCIRLAERVVALICCEKLHKIGKNV